ncbi:WAT1-related protein At3g45870 [Exaiptasia diaphana]|uniref:EamA domain-containing protein n=1 Tax=Exaiptasia diaphana TaxID=2652724 RepID=A0A913Y5B6_EXADI|nr:WAT1-related protein At3g45870 [Exaiptasia diaphana]KXJ22509.1 WAT1-related protein [Exaiptasia diaphana]
MASMCLVLVALVVIQLGFGAYGVVVAKFAVKSKADPLIFSMIRDAGAFPVILLAGFISERRLDVPKLRELPMFAILGFVGMFGNQLPYILGIYYTSANIASIFQPSIPVWTAILAVITRMEPLPPINKAHGWAKILGILLATTGAVTMVLDKVKSEKGEMKSSYGLGYLFLIINTLCTAIYMLLQKKLIFNKVDSPWKQKPITLTAWSYLFGTIFMALSSLYYVFTNQFEKFTYFPQEEIYPIIYAIFVASSLCYMLITWCNMQISATVVTATWPLQVLFCAVLSYVILDEVLTTLEYIGALLIISGLFAVIWSSYVLEKEIETQSKESYGYVRVSDGDGFIPETEPKTQKIN